MSADVGGGQPMLPPNTEFFRAMFCVHTCYIRLNEVCLHYVYVKQNAYHNQYFSYTSVSDIRNGCTYNFFYMKQELFS